MAGTDSERFDWWVSRLCHSIYRERVGEGYKSLFTIAGNLAKI